MDYWDARFALVRGVNRFLAGSLKNLLEEIHLYQSSPELAFDKLHEPILKQVIGSSNQASFVETVQELPGEWFVPSEIELTMSAGSKQGPSPTLLVQNIKLYCSRCKQDETFSPTWYTDLAKGADERHGREHRIASPPPGYQVFGLLFQCERCKSLPVSFLVKRREWKLTVEGRSPFEEVVLPPFIPKKESWLLSGAIVAAQTSNTLAGLFYLRSFIEQFARRQTGIKDRKSGEEILDAYQALLPEGKRDHMPSLRSSYEKLSVAVHAASPDDELFKRTLELIVEHFDYRRMYKIPDEVVQSGG
jgi:hypothetical protein